MEEEDKDDEVEKATHPKMKKQKLNAVVNVEEEETLHSATQGSLIAFNLITLPDQPLGEDSHKIGTVCHKIRAPTRLFQDREQPSKYYLECTDNSYYELYEADALPTLYQDSLFYPIYVTLISGKLIHPSSCLTLVRFMDQK